MGMDLKPNGPASGNLRYFVVVVSSKKIVVVEKIPLFPLAPEAFYRSRTEPTLHTVNRRSAKIFIILVMFHRRLIVLKN